MLVRGRPSCSTMATTSRLPASPGPGVKVIVPEAPSAVPMTRDVSAPTSAKVTV